MRSFIGNAFSPNMVGDGTVLRIDEASASDVPQDAESCVGHESTAAVLSDLLGRPVPARRVAVSLETGDRLFLVAIFDRNGKPFRPAEGQVLTADELGALELRLRVVSVL